MSMRELEELNVDLKSLLPTASSILPTTQTILNELKTKIRDLLGAFSNKLADLAMSQPPPNHHHVQLTDDEGLLKNSDIEKFMSELLELHNQLMKLLDEIRKKISIMYGYLEEMYEQMESFDAEMSDKIGDYNDYFMECSNFLNSHEEELSNLQTNIDWLKEQISSWKDATLEPLIFIIEEQLFPRLQDYLYSDMRTKVVDMITEESWRRFVEILDYVNVFQLISILATQPKSNITIIVCWEKVRFVYWKLNKDDLHMPLGGNIWSKLMGPVMDQLSHEICGAIVSAELVSVVRHILGRDTPKINYSVQDLIDFTKPSLRAVPRPNGHHCYPCHVRDFLEYVRTMGIERAEARPLEIKCKKYVRPRNPSNLGYIGGVERIEGLEKTLQQVQHHPVAATIPIFEPEYTYIRNNIYRGATSRISRYVTMHAVNIMGSDEENGEKFVWVRSSHGPDFGVDGNLKVSAEIMMMCLAPGKYGAFIENSFPLLTEFIYPTLLSPEEEARKREEDHR